MLLASPAACAVTALVDDRQDDQDGVPHSANRPSGGLEQEDDDQVDREPGRVEEGEQAVTGQELAQVGQVGSAWPALPPACLRFCSKAAV
jgi:hypothetical protein